MKDVLDMSDTSSLQQLVDEHPKTQDVQPREHPTKPNRPNLSFMQNSVSILAEITSINIFCTFWAGLKTSICFSCNTRDG